MSFRRDKSTGRLSAPRRESFQATPTDMAMSADGARLYVSGAGSEGFFPLSGIAVYSRRAGSTALDEVEFQTEDERFFQRPSLTRSVALSMDGRHVYAGALSGLALAPFLRVEGDGSLEPVPDPGGPSAGLGRLRGAKRAAVSPDGRQVYVANAANDTLSVFARREDGGLDFVEVHRAPEAGRASTVAVSPDGRWVYALNGVLRRNPENGRLRQVAQGRSFYREAVELAPSGDGRHLYVADAPFGFRPLRVFRRSSNGGLVEGRIEIDPVPGLGRLGPSYSAAVSPDGAFVYAVGFFERSPPRGDERDALWVFARDRSSGALRLAHFRRLGRTDFTAPPPRLALSPDGRHVYLLRPGEGDLQVFGHDQRGVLTRIEAHTDVAGLEDPRDLVVTPSGQLVFVAGRGSDAVAVFARDPGTGKLDLLEVVQEGQAGIDGLFRVEGLAVSPDSRHLYALSPRLSGITALALD